MTASTMPVNSKPPIFRTNLIRNWRIQLSTNRRYWTNQRQTTTTDPSWHALSSCHVKLDTCQRFDTLIKVMTVSTMPVNSKPPIFRTNSIRNCRVHLSTNQRYWFNQRQTTPTYSPDDAQSDATTLIKNGPIIVKQIDEQLSLAKNRFHAKRFKGVHGCIKTILPVKFHHDLTSR
jgi:hypothetical protein